MLSFKKFLLENANDDDYNAELNYANRLIMKEVQIEGFDYYEDYVKTIAKEASAIKGSCIFVGSGPVPLTPILLKKNHNIDVTALEYNSQAVQISQKLLEILDLRINVIHGDAIKFQGFRNFGTIMLALEAGPTEATKRAIFENIKNQITPQTQLIIRGSANDGGAEGFQSVENYVSNYFHVIKKIPVFSNLSTTYVLHCSVCPTHSVEKSL